jgi:hypothetical protein
MSSFLKKFYALFLIAFLIFTFNAEYVIASPANGGSGDTGSGDSAGNDGGGGNSSGDGNDTSVGGNFNDGGSGGGSNQNNSGDEGNNNGPTTDDGYNCGSDCTAPVLSANPACLGTQPIVNLTWSGVPIPSAANAWLGTTSFLMRNPRIFTGVVVQSNLRTFGVAYFPYGTFSFQDTYREYWRPAYTIPAWTEITGTDENGNPTGAVDHPAQDVPTALVLTDTVSPNTTYLYQIYSSNASATPTYSSTVQGLTPNLNYTSRTPVSNIVTVTTDACDGTTTPSPAPSVIPSLPSVAPSTTSALPSVVPSIAPLPYPIVNISLTTPRGNFSSGGLPVTVYQNEEVILNWSIQNATSAVATSNPNHPSWDGAKDPNSGFQPISTTTVGSYVFTLIGTNSTGSIPVSIQLNVKAPVDPYIQTTQGDVHSNSDINVPE